MTPQTHAPAPAGQADPAGGAVLGALSATLESASPAPSPPDGMRFRSADGTVVTLMPGGRRHEYQWNAALPGPDAPYGSGRVTRGGTITESRVGPLTSTPGDAIEGFVRAALRKTPDDWFDAADRYGAESLVRKQKRLAQAHLSKLQAHLDQLHAAELDLAVALLPPGAGRDLGTAMVQAGFAGTPDDLLAAASGATADSSA